jgi:SSS family solute:Na+ symporter
MAGFTGVLIAYAVLGGQRAVIKTDVVQAGIILVGLGVAAISLLSIRGGLAALGGALPSGALSFPVSSDFGWGDVVRLLLLVGTAYMVGPDMYSRVLSARTTPGARAAALYAAIALVPVAFLTAGMGMVARVLAPGIAPETALPWLINTALPEAVAAILLLGLVAALMSSADSTLLGQGIVLANDIVGRLWQLEDRNTVRLARLSVVSLGLAALAIASHFGGVIPSLMFAYSIFASGVVGPVLLGLFGGRFRPTANVALLGLCLGGLLGLLGALPLVAVPFKPLLPVIGLLTSVLVPLGVTALRLRFSQSDLMV